ncbi:MAG: hypothetical protein V1873_08915 [Verrucomicrobiota bacterium]
MSEGQNQNPFRTLDVAMAGLFCAILVTAWLNWRQSTTGGFVAQVVLIGLLAVVVFLYSAVGKKRGEAGEAAPEAAAKAKGPLILLGALLIAAAVVVWGTVFKFAPVKGGLGQLRMPDIPGLRQLGKMMGAVSGQPSVSRFLGELRKETYADTTAPSAPVLRWDFSTKEVRKYAYEQEVRATTETGRHFGLGGGNIEQTMSAQGDLLVKGQGNGMADLVLQDVKVGVKMDSPAGKPITMEQVMPPTVIQGMKEDGSGSSCNSAEAMFLGMLFPLPPKTLAVGESVDVPAQLPFNAMGSLLQVNGRSRITLARYVRIGERTCAEFDVDVDISDLKVPAELKGEYTCATKGASVFYFDVDKRRFVSGATALLMAIGIDAPMPKLNVDVPGEEMPKLPGQMKMSMVSDNLIRVSLKE